jgi:SAM-dependent methyltransferase
MKKLRLTSSYTLSPLQKIAEATNENGGSDASSSSGSFSGLLVENQCLESQAPLPSSHTPLTTLEYIWITLFIICGIMVAYNLVFQLMRSSKPPHGHDWNLTVTADQVKNWTKEYTDEHLHELSRWGRDLNRSEWIQTVKYSYNPLNITPWYKRFTYLEIGVGVGAWSRVFLKHFPNARGTGLDIDAKAIDIARVVLPLENMPELVVSHFMQTTVLFKDRQFDYVFLPGTLCYAKDIWQVSSFIHGLVSNNVIRKGGYLVASMMLSNTSHYPQKTSVPLSFWYAFKHYQVVWMENMDLWNLPYDEGRYAVYLQVI